MYTVIRDNRDILRYRGLLNPGTELTSLQDAAISLAVLQLGTINTNALGRFSTGEKTDANKQVTTNPFMRLLPESGGTTDNAVYDFYFPYVPQGIDYSDMSDEVAEIQRAGTTPIVTFRGHRLMKVSMEFLVAVPYDGLLLDVQDSLEILRIFSTNSQRSVIFYHMDKYLTSGYNYRKGPNARPPAFNITEMSVNARQRNAIGKVTQAVVRLSLVENRNPDIVITKVPPFKKRRPKKVPKLTTIPKDQKVSLYTETADVTIR